MKVTGNEKHKISLNDAKKFTSGYRKEKAEFMTADKMKEKEAKKGGFFAKPDLEDLLNQPGCIGMRYYYGRDDEGKKNLVLCGVDKDGNDILPSEDKARMAVESRQEQGIMLEKSLPCPPFCSNNVLLND